MRTLRYLFLGGLAVTLGTACGGISGQLSGTGGHGAGGAGGAGGQGGVVCGHLCALNDDPVCGTDGVTYLNSCAADCAGAAIAYQGACVDAGAGGAPGTCNTDSDCVVEPTGCCTQACGVKGTPLPQSLTVCNAAVSCPFEDPPPACACVNHQCGVAGTGGAGGGAAGAGGAGGTAGTAGTSGAAGSSGVGGAGGALGCGYLAEAYAAALPVAEQCDLGATGTCQQVVSSSLSPCFSNCTTYVNDVTALNAIKATWLQQKCDDVAVFCPAIACVQPTTSACVAGDGGGGVCQAVFSGPTN